jgi:hypothetical protein
VISNLPEFIFKILCIPKNKSMVLKGIETYTYFSFTIEESANSKFKLYLTLDHKIIKGGKIHILTYAQRQQPKSKYKTKNTYVPQSL